MKFKIVSTFSDDGYNVYGKYFVNSLKNFVSRDINIELYVDTVSIPEQDNLKILKLEPSIPELTNFKNRNKNKIFKDYRWDGVRFAHKAYAIFHSSTDDIDYLIWLDSDTEIYNFITPEYLIKFLPDDCFVGYIGRDGTSETGFLIFNMKHAESKNFFNRFKWYYDSDNIYSADEYHDAYIFDIVRKEFESSGLIKTFNVSPQGVTKGHFNAAFNGYMIHYKGNDKSQRDSKIKKILKRK